MTRMKKIAKLKTYKQGPALMKPLKHLQLISFQVCPNALEFTYNLKRPMFTLGLEFFHNLSFQVVDHGYIPCENYYIVSIFINCFSCLCLCGFSFRTISWVLSQKTMKDTNKEKNIHSRCKVQTIPPLTGLFPLTSPSVQHPLTSLHCLSAMSS